MKTKGNKIKVAFFGTSDRSTPLLNKLHASLDLALCITKMDTKVGRTQKLRKTEVKKWAIAHEVPFVEIDSTRGKNKDAVISALKEHSVDIGVVADFSFILPEDIINSPKHGMINIHFSLLPKYRGASPVQFSILNGDAITGVTFYKMDKGMDTGDIIFQFEHELKGTEISGEVWETLFYRSSEHLTRIISEYISGTLEPLTQREEDATYTKSKTMPKHTFIFKDDAKIDWESSPALIEREIRAYNPWPISWTTLEDMEKSSQLKIKIRGNKDKSLRVKIYEAYLDNEVLKIDKLQVAGSNIIGWDEFVNGYVV